MKAVALFSYCIDTTIRAPNGLLIETAPRTIHRRMLMCNSDQEARVRIVVVASDRKDDYSTRWDKRAMYLSQPIASHVIPLGEGIYKRRSRNGRKIQALSPCKAPRES
jgi:hypothetical protein